MSKRAKLSSILMATAFVRIEAGQAKAQWDRSYLEIYPQCDMTENFNSSIQQQYLQAFGDPNAARQAILRDLYRLETRCLQSQQQQNSNQSSPSRVYQVPDYEAQTRERLRQSCEAVRGRVWTGTSCADMRY
jgi:hypothetical protein